MMKSDHVIVDNNKCPTDNKYLATGNCKSKHPNPTVVLATRDLCNFRNALES